MGKICEKSFFCNRISYICQLLKYPVTNPICRYITLNIHFLHLLP